MAKFPEAEARLIKGKFICRRCKSVMRTDTRRVVDGTVKCRRCNNHDFKAKRKK